MNDKQHYEKLNELIQQLEAELDKVEEGAPNPAIQTLKSDLEALKNSAGNGESAPTESISEEITSPFLEASVNFEKSHPKVANVLNDIAYLLNNIGI